MMITLYYVRMSCITNGSCKLQALHRLSLSVGFGAICCSKARLKARGWVFFQPSPHFHSNHVG